MKRLYLVILLGVLTTSLFAQYAPMRQKYEFTNDVRFGAAIQIDSTGLDLSKDLYLKLDTTGVAATGYVTFTYDTVEAVAPIPPQEWLPIETNIIEYAIGEGIELGVFIDGLVDGINKLSSVVSLEGAIRLTFSTNVRTDVFPINSEIQMFITVGAAQSLEFREDGTSVLTPYTANTLDTQGNHFVTIKRISTNSYLVY